MFQGRNWRDRKAVRRNGIASFELVMSAPILMFLIAMLFTTYSATVKKSHVTMEVRHVPWLVRTDPAKADQGQQPFGTVSVTRSGREYHDKTTYVSAYRNWYPTVPRRILWGNVVLTGSWDYREVEFEEGGFVPIYPHLAVLSKMATQGGVQTNSGLINELQKIIKIPGLP